MNRRLLLGLFLLIVIPVASFAADKRPSLPKGLPTYGSLKPFQAPQVSVQRLSNGVTLWLVSRPGFPKVALEVVIRGGMAADPPDRPGFSELILATVDQGTKTRSAKQIAEGFQAAGGDLSGNALADSLVLATDVLSSKEDAALSVLSDVLANATFPDQEVELAKRNATDNLQADESQPGFLARRALAKAVFGGHPYSVVSPTEESITKTTAEELRKEYARRFRPDQALLVAVGDFDAGAFTALAEKTLGKWTAPNSHVEPPVPTSPQSSPHAVFLVERPNSVQTTFALASLGPTERAPDYAATEVAVAIYGGMFGSRLVNNIREDKGYTYSPGAYLQERSAAGLLQTHADVRNAVTGASLNEIDYELNRMATTAPLDEEVEHAQRYLVGVRAISLQSQGSVARQLATLWVYGLPPEELGAESEKIEKVTPAEVEAAGEKYFASAHQTIVAVGEEKAIRKQIAPFGLEVRVVK